VNKLSSVEVVQAQLDAYNAKDIEGIMATYAEDAQQFEFPSTLLANGAAEIRERLLARFKEPNLNAKLNHRIVIGNRVIDHETVTRTFPEGTGTIELVAVYEVKDGKIVKAWFMAGAKSLD
jgi:hypothetical protein